MFGDPVAQVSVAGERARVYYIAQDREPGGEDVSDDVDLRVRSWRACGRTCLVVQFSPRIRIETVPRCGWPRVDAAVVRGRTNRMSKWLRSVLVDLSSWVMVHDRSAHGSVRCERAKAMLYQWGH